MRFKQCYSIAILKYIKKKNSFILHRNQITYIVQNKSSQLSIINQQSGIKHHKKNKCKLIKYQLEKVVKEIKIVRQAKQNLKLKKLMINIQTFKIKREKNKILQIYMIIKNNLKVDYLLIYLKQLKKNRYCKEIIIIAN